MDVLLTDCDEAEDYVVPNVLSPRYLVTIPGNMDETVLHWEPEPIIVCSNDDPGLALTYFTTRSNFATYAFI